MLKSLTDDVLIGGNHLANMLIKNNIMPAEIGGPDEVDDADLRDVWLAWRAIMNLSNYIEQTSGYAMIIANQHRQILEDGKKR